MADARDRMARIRAKIEEADGKLAEALDLRAQAVREFVAVRDQDPDGYHALPSADQVLARLGELRKDFPAEALEVVVRDVLGACAAMVEPVTVAVPAPEAGLAHLAARRYFGAAARVAARDTVEASYADVEDGRAQFGVVPFETSTDGAISATLHCLAQGNARVVGELTLMSGIHLYSRTGNAADVEKVYGSAAAIAATEKTIRAAFPRAALLDVRSGLVAAQFAMEDHGVAALGTELIADVHRELRVARSNVEDVQGVETRFLVLGRVAARRSGTDRTLLVLALSEDPGSLYAALAPFAERGVNLTRLESRPARGTFQAAYGGRDLFLVELDGHVSDRPVLAALDEVKIRARHVKIVGSYPRPTAV